MVYLTLGTVREKPKVASGVAYRQGVAYLAGEKRGYVGGASLALTLSNPLTRRECRPCYLRD